MTAHFHDVSRIQDELGGLVCRLQQFRTASLGPSSPSPRPSTLARIVSAVLYHPLLLRLRLTISPAVAVVDRANELKRYASAEWERRQRLRERLSAWHGERTTGSSRRGGEGEQGAVFLRVMRVACGLAQKAEGWRMLAEDDLLTLEAKVRDVDRSDKPPRSFLQWLSVNPEKKKRARQG